jgi:hypothetical protein
VIRRRKSRATAGFFVADDGISLGHTPDMGRSAKLTGRNSGDAQNGMRGIWQPVLDGRYADLNRSV